jgi:hypothetical protein
LNKESSQLQRGLKNRHIQLIAMGGAIGTGLFLGSAHVIESAGPSIILGYAIGGSLSHAEVETTLYSSYFSPTRKFLWLTCWANNMSKRCKTCLNRTMLKQWCCQPIF